MSSATSSLRHGGAVDEYFQIEVLDRFSIVVAVVFGVRLPIQDARAPKSGNPTVKSSVSFCGEENFSNLTIFIGRVADFDFDNRSGVSVAHLPQSTGYLDGRFWRRPAGLSAAPFFLRLGYCNVSMPMAQAVMRALAVNAAKGQHRAQRLFAEMLSTTERQNKQLADEWLNTAMDYKIEWDRELLRRERMGITGLPPPLPLPLPHPDQVKIDMNTGNAWIEEPVTKDEKVELDEWARKRDLFKEELEVLHGELAAADDEKQRAFLKADMAQSAKIVDMIENLLDLKGNPRLGTMFD